MNAPEVARHFVVFPESDATEGVVDLEAGFAQCGACICDGRRCCVAPQGIAHVPRYRCAKQQQPTAFDRHQTIDQLVLDGLVMADRVAELDALLSVVDHQLETAPRGAKGARSYAQAHEQCEVCGCPRPESYDLGTHVIEREA